MALDTQQPGQNRKALSPGAGWGIKTTLTCYWQKCVSLQPSGNLLKLNLYPSISTPVCKNIYVRVCVYAEIGNKEIPHQK